MSKNVILNLAISIDGYIATKDHKIDWLNQSTTEFNGEMIDYFSNFLKRIDVIVMGKNAYAVTNSLEKVSKQFPGKKIVVFSNEKIDDPSIEVVSGTVESIIKKIEGNVWLFGGAQLVKSFIEKDLVTEMEIGIIPITIGSGIPLFLENSNVSKWELKSNKTINETVFLNYKRREK